MNNLEKYQNELSKYLIEDSFSVARNGEIRGCRDYSRTFYAPCVDCLFNNSPDGCIEARKDWLTQEYVEPEVDWSKVPVDTPILVKNFERDLWTRRYFAKYENGKVYAWDGGRTSWSVNKPNEIVDWPIAKLAEE